MNFGVNIWGWRRASNSLTWRYWGKVIIFVCSSDIHTAATCLPLYKHFAPLNLYFLCDKRKQGKPQLLTDLLFFSGTRCLGCLAILWSGVDWDQLSRAIDASSLVRSIQLFRQRLSHNSEKSYATMPIGIVGRKSLTLIDWGSRCLPTRKENA